MATSRQYFIATKIYEQTEPVKNDPIKFSKLYDLRDDWNRSLEV